MLAGYHGAFTDGNYIYYLPQYNSVVGSSGFIVRVPIDDWATGAYEFIDITPSMPCMNSGFTDGMYAYFCPAYGNSLSSRSIPRIPLNNFTMAAVEYRDFKLTDGTATDRHPVITYYLLQILLTTYYLLPTTSTIGSDLHTFNGCFSDAYTTYYLLLTTSTPSTDT